VTCGILAFRFARARCTDCRQERLVAFSCKGRYVCPSCTNRRMAEVAAHLRDSVVPVVPMRQWVLSVPNRLRPHLMRDSDLASAVLRIPACAPFGTSSGPPREVPTTEALGALAIIPEAARIQRQLAGRLPELERRDEALSELRKVHEVFGRLGAQPEMSKAREQFRELGSRPPSRSEAEGTADLTPREAEIARLFADRKSNKAIAKHLGISPRTVSTHLSNLYRKLEIGSRGELVDLVREARLPLEPQEPPPM